MKFQLESPDEPGTRARAARLTTLHGAVETPMFMPVGTQATVRNQRLAELEAIGAPMLLANTVHLLRRPGLEVFRKLGGIHGLMGWKGAVLTDSGGYQVFSLAEYSELNEQGVRFKLPDSAELALTPELSLEAQRAIGSDIMMALDQCVPAQSELARAREAVERTERWARRSFAARGDSGAWLFGIVQGACFPELRRRSAEGLLEIPFDGYAIGGLAVGESKTEREDLTELTAALLPKDRPRYLMGVGTPLDILEAIHRGVDLFDCIIPTSYAQRGTAFTMDGRLDLRKGSYRLAEDPLEAGCPCEACARHSRAYLHHLFQAREPIAWQLVGAHNLRFYRRLVAEARAAILAGEFRRFYQERRERLDQRDRETRLGDFALVRSRYGFATLKESRRGEQMHSVGAVPGAEASLSSEAEWLYVKQSRLAERLRSREPRPLVIWDVGLGAAVNAMAALRCYREVVGRARERCVERSERCEAARPLELVSFESDLNALRLALRFSAEFPHLADPAARALAERGEWREGGLRWQLREGDFLRELATAPVPELIFFDPFSPKTNPELWTLEAFAALFARATHAGDAGAWLFTYSASTAVRGRMLAAGFHVARGLGTGQKRETTVALTPAARSAGDSYPVLGPDWLERWQRSGACIPALTPRILEHPQFAGH